MAIHPSIIIAATCTVALAAAAAAHGLRPQPAAPSLSAIHPYVAPAQIIPHDDPPPQAPRPADDGGPDYPRLPVPPVVEQEPAPAPDNGAIARARAMSLRRGIDMMQRELAEAQGRESAAAQAASADQARLDDLNGWYDWQQTHRHPLTAYQYHQYLDNAEGIATDIRNDRQAAADARSHKSSLQGRIEKAQQELEEAQDDQADQP